jgi:peptide chain release factor
MTALGCAEGDLEERLTRGPGVTITHRPSGVRVQCCREKSQALNRFLARRLLLDELEARGQNKTRHQVKAERIREEKRRRRALGKTGDPFQLRPLQSPEHGQPPHGLSRLLGKLGP